MSMSHTLSNMCTTVRLYINTLLYIYIHFLPLKHACTHRIHVWPSLVFCQYLLGLVLCTQPFFIPSYQLHIHHIRGIILILVLLHGSFKYLDTKLEMLDGHTAARMKLCDFLAFHLINMPKYVNLRADGRRKYTFKAQYVCGPLLAFNMSFVRFFRN